MHVGPRFSSESARCNQHEYKRHGQFLSHVGVVESLISNVVAGKHSQFIYRARKTEQTTATSAVTSHRVIVILQCEANAARQRPEKAPRGRWGGGCHASSMAKTGMCLLLPRESSGRGRSSHQWWWRRLWRVLLVVRLLVLVQLLLSGQCRGRVRRGMAPCVLLQACLYVLTQSHRRLGQCCGRSGRRQGRAAGSCRREEARGGLTAIAGVRRRTTEALLQRL